LWEKGNKTYGDDKKGLPLNIEIFNDFKKKENIETPAFGTARFEFSEQTDHVNRYDIKKLF